MDDLVLPLRTPRLVLRPLLESDFACHQQLFSNPEVVRYLYEPVLEGAELRAHFEKRLWQGLREEGHWANLAVEHEGRFVGEVGLGLADEVNAKAEIGYVFLPQYTGRGFATEAAERVVELCFDYWRVRRVIACLDARNDGSSRVCERLGFRLEAHFVENEIVKGELTSEKIYAVLDREWQERRSRRSLDS